MLKILIIEEDITIRSLLNNKLSQVGYDVFTSGEGKDALILAHEIKPDLLLLDLDLKSIDAFIILEEISEDLILRRIPIIAIINSVDQAILDKAMELGVKDWFVKTEIGLHEIANRVATAIGK